MSISHPGGQLWSLGVDITDGQNERKATLAKDRWENVHFARQPYSLLVTRNEQARLGEQTGITLRTTTE